MLLSWRVVGGGVPAGLDEFVGHLADAFDLDAHEGGLYSIPHRLE
jgi:hypothetical protein